MRKASAIQGTTFPYTDKAVCYIEQLPSGEIMQIDHYVRERKAVYYRVVNEGSKLYAVWPGRYTSELFEIDDIQAYGKAYNLG